MEICQIELNKHDSTNMKHIVFFSTQEKTNDLFSRVGVK